MQGQRKGVKAFLQSRVGKILLIVIAILAVLGAFLFAGVLFAILAVLVFGLGVPIWSGVSQPKYLAILGVAVLAVSPALITAVEVPIILTAPGAASSADGVMQNAGVSPFVGMPGSTFNWTVEVVPGQLPAGFSTVNLTLYVSTCPGATGNSSPYCSSGYPFYWIGVNQTRAANLTQPTTFTIPFIVPSSDIWDWQIGLYYAKWNTTTHAWQNLTFDLLAGDATYNSIQGPVTANWNGNFYAGTYYLLIGSVYETIVLYLGLAFYIALLVYMIFRVRRQRRQQAAERSRPPPSTSNPAPAPLPSGPAPPPGGTVGRAGGASGTAPKETACPNCGAVVYRNETFCWKCGSALGQPGSGGSTGPTPPKG